MLFILQTKFFKMSRKKVLILLALLSVFIGVAVIFSVFRPSGSTVRSVKTDVKTDVASLLKAFENNEKKANSLYLDKIIQVTGSVNEVIDDGTFITVTLKNPGQSSGVMCSFDKNEVDKDTFISGDEITIKGLCTGYLIDVILVKCSIIE
jgi:hypothetical protein